MRASFSLSWMALALAVCAVLGSATAGAQGPPPAASPASSPTSTSRPDALWRCELPGGVYLVALRSVVSVSSHEFVVDGQARVTEVTVATARTVEARFDYLEPVAVPSPAALPSIDQLQQRVQDATASHAAVDPVWQKVVKNYPTTTHAHTVEYRLASKADLQSLRLSLEQAWTTGKGANFKIQ